MQAPSSLTCLWPGLPNLWWRGDWRALVVAVLFAVALNFWLLTTLVWPEMISTAVRLSGWIALLGLWSSGAWLGARRLSTLRCGRVEAEHQGLFVQAQVEYLRGHWIEAEALLRELLDVQDADGDARLLLACLLRRSGRPVEALAELEWLERTEAGQKWLLEIARERKLLSAIMQSSAGTND